MKQEENAANRQKTPVSFPIEGLFLFCAFYLPSCLFPGVSGSEFDSLVFHLRILLSVVPQSGLVIILCLNRFGSVAEAGMGKPTLKGLIPAIPLLLFLLLCSAGLTAVLNSLPAPNQGGFWRFTNRPLIPLLAVTCLASGYGEELFFRAYLISGLRASGRGTRTSALVSSLLFAACHGYEGIPGLIIGFVSGLILSAGFIGTRNIHTVGIAHGLYNFCALVVFSSVI